MWFWSLIVLVTTLMMASLLLYRICLFLFEREIEKLKFQAHPNSDITCKENLTNTRRNAGLLLYFAFNALHIVVNAERLCVNDSASQEFMCSYLIFVFVLLMFLFLNKENSLSYICIV